MGCDCIASINLILTYIVSVGGGNKCIGKSGSVQHSPAIKLFFVFELNVLLYLFDEFLEGLILCSLRGTDCIV